MGERGEKDCAVNHKSRQPPVDGVNVGFFLREGVGVLTCLPSKFERDECRQPREITFIEAWVFQQQRIKFNKLTTCDRLLGLPRDGAAMEEGYWTCEELIPSSGKSKLVSCCWRAMDGDGDCDGCRAETPWLGAETDWSFWSGIQEIRVMRTTGLKLGFAFGGTPSLRPPCCRASFAAMLFELEVSETSESSETTTGLVAEVDADWELWLVCAYFEGGSEASELRLWWGKSMYPRIQEEDFIGQGRVFHSC